VKSHPCGGVTVIAPTALGSIAGRLGWQDTWRPTDRLGASVCPSLVSGDGIDRRPRRTEGYFWGRRYRGPYPASLSDFHQHPCLRSFAHPGPAFIRVNCALQLYLHLHPPPPVRRRRDDGGCEAARRQPARAPCDLARESQADAELVLMLTPAITQPRPARLRPTARSMAARRRPLRLAARRLHGPQGCRRFPRPAALQLAVDASCAQWHAPPAAVAVKPRPAPAVADAGPARPTVSVSRRQAGRGRRRRATVSAPTLGLLQAACPRAERVHY
jgi:hypothetical protein